MAYSHWAWTNHLNLSLACSETFINPGQFFRLVYVYLNFLPLIYLPRTSLRILL